MKLEGQRYRFGPYELDVRAGELRKRRTRLRIGKQPFTILTMLLERRGATVLREEIQARLWPNQTVVEFDHSISSAVRQLRSVLSDSAAEPRYVETVPRGYGMMADVEEIDGLETEGKSVVPRPGLNREPTFDPNSLTGKTISHFRIHEKLGSGGMGVVYRAEDLNLGRNVALKFLPCPVEALPELVRQRFDREARALASLHHPHICTVFAVESIDGQPVIVMEFVEGESLATRLARGAVSSAEAIPLAIQVAGALSEAHRRGITHRDLKPANIMITISGAKLLDFGLVKSELAPVNGSASGHDPTINGTILGTPHYMSPEQAQGKETDCRTDIFSFGVVLYETLTGQRAFAADTPAGAIAAVLERELPSLPASASGLQRILSRCLARNPEDRWQSASDLKASLELLAESSGSIPVATLPTPPVPLKARSLGWLAAAVLGIAVILIARSVSG